MNRTFEGGQGGGGRPRPNVFLGGPIKLDIIFKSKISKRLTLVVSLN